MFNLPNVGLEIRMPKSRNRPKSVVKRSRKNKRQIQVKASRIMERRKLEAALSRFSRPVGNVLYPVLEDEK
jgi:hypothetical protein